MQPAALKRVHGGTPLRRFADRSPRRYRPCRSQPTIGRARTARRIPGIDALCPHQWFHLGVSFWLEQRGYSAALRFFASMAMILSQVAVGCTLTVVSLLTRVVIEIDGVPKSTCPDPGVFGTIAGHGVFVGLKGGSHLDIRGCLSATPYNVLAFQVNVAASTSSIQRTRLSSMTKPYLHREPAYGLQKPDSKGNDMSILDLKSLREAVTGSAAAFTA